MTYRSMKTYGHEIGLSCAFRQWRADSHCRFLHGYALAVRFEFEADELDDCNWVVDFGGLGTLKEQLKYRFDHKLIIAEDDPQLDLLSSLAGLGVAEITILPAVGCEAFAKYIHEMGEMWLFINGYEDRVRLHSVEVREHGANSAIYIRKEGAQ